MGKSFRKIRLFCILMAVVAVSIIFPGGIQAGSEQENPGKNKLRIALIPEENSFDQIRRYSSISWYLSKETGYETDIILLPDYGAVCDAFLKDEIDAGFLGSFSYILAHTFAGAEVIARPVWENGSSTYTGYIFVRKDSSIASVPDMRGKTMALVSKATTAGYIFQLAYLKENGVKNIDNFFSKIFFAKSHDISAWAVYTGEADVGGAKNHIFNKLAEENPDFADNIVILAESPKVPSNGFVVKKDMNPGLKDEIKDIFLKMNESRKGKEILKKFGAIGFIKTTDKDYAKLYSMIESSGINLEDYKTFCQTE